MPRSVTRHPPHSATAASSIARFASRIWPGPGGTPLHGSTTSSPVESTATCGVPYTVTSAAPT
eukprot:34930-Chlamydomonas_euryale.AAC.1